MDADFDKLIAQLRVLQEHPKMFTGDADPWRVQSFLWGFSCALKTSGLIPSQKTCENASYKRLRLKGKAIGPIGEMRERGMSDPEIVTELIEIEIDALREIQKSL